LYDGIIEALRNETPLPDLRFDAFRRFTFIVVCNRDAVDDNAVETFLSIGFTKRQILEVILGTDQKVISNYTNNLAQTPIDGSFGKYRRQRS